MRRRLNSDSSSATRFTRSTSSSTTTPLHCSSADPAECERSFDRTSSVPDRCDNLRRWAFMLAVCLAAGCAPKPAPTSAPTSPPTTATPTTATPTTAPALTSPTTAPTTSGCTPADPAQIRTIEDGLIGNARRLGEAFTADTGTRTYVNANIYPAAGDRLSSGDVWVIDGGVVYSLSSGARDLSRFPDGRKTLPDRPSAGDDIPAGLERCVTAALRAENADPGR